MIDMGKRGGEEDGGASAPAFEEDGTADSHRRENFVEMDGNQNFFILLTILRQQ